MHLLLSEFVLCQTKNSHINRIVSNASHTLNFVRCNIKTKMPKVRETAYNSIVRPQFEYPSAVWDPESDQNSLLVKRQTDNTTPGGMGLDPNHKKWISNIE